MSAPTWLRATIVAALGLGTLLAVACAGWTVQGWRKDADIAALKASIATANQAAANARAELAQGVLKAEREARDGIQAIVDKFTKEKDAAKNEKDALIAGVRSGAIRLSIPVVAPVPAGAGCANAAAADGTGGQARAELAPAAAGFLDDIAGEGDDAIRQANAVIDIYNKVREKLNVQAEKSTGISAEGR